MTEAIERLSTGKRINRSSDDPAGFQKIIRLKSQIQGMTVASKNATGGQALLNLTDGALEEVQTILLRMRELSVQASGTNTTSDKVYINNEITALELEITRIGSNTSHAGQEVFTSEAKIIQIGPNSGDSFVINQFALSAHTLGLTSDVLTATNAQNYLSIIDHAIVTISGKRGTLGASINRLGHVISNLDNMKLSLSKSKGLIEDTDFAFEIAKLVKAKILQQAAIYMLAQANTRKTMILKLLE